MCKILRNTLYADRIIYFALVLAQAPSNIYISPEANKFVKAVAIGAEQSLGIGSNNQPDYFSKTCENGMFTYLRLLLATNIDIINDCRTYLFSVGDSRRNAYFANLGIFSDQNTDRICPRRIKVI